MSMGSSASPLSWQSHPMQIAIASLSLLLVSIHSRNVYHVHTSHIYNVLFIPLSFLQPNGPFTWLLHSYRGCGRTVRLSSCNHLSLKRRLKSRRALLTTDGVVCFIWAAQGHTWRDVFLQCLQSIHTGNRAREREMRKQFHKRLQRKKKTQVQEEDGKKRTPRNITQYLLHMCLSFVSELKSGKSIFRHSCPI